jgi:hypothetical protein
MIRLLQNWFWILAAFLLLPSPGIAAYQPHRFGRPIKQDDRYFIVKQMLPPLQRDDVLTTLSGYGESIPVTYTNSPEGVSTWLKENVLDGGCTIGFDVEVSRLTLVCM